MIRGAVDRGGDETSNDGGCRSDLAERAAAYRAAATVGAVVVRGHGVLPGFGSARCATHHPHERDRPNRHPAQRKNSGPGLSKPPGPFVADAGTRQRTGAETKDRRES